MVCGVACRLEAAPRFHRRAFSNHPTHGSVARGTAIPSTALKMSPAWALVRNFLIFCAGVRGGGLLLWLGLLHGSHVV